MDRTTDAADAAPELLGLPERPATTASPQGIFTGCPQCDGPMHPEHAHYRCRRCGWRDSCCD